MSAIKATQEAEVRIQAQPSKVIKTLSKKQAKDVDYGQNIMYSSMKMKKMRPVETIPGMQVGKINYSDGGGEFK
jgi:hypothetical protein